MQLSSPQVKRFQKIYESHFAVLLSEDEAREKGLQLIEIMESIYRPVTKKPPEKSL